MPPSYMPNYQPQKLLGETDPEAVSRNLSKWLPQEGPAKNVMEAAGLHRNTVRTAEAWGPSLIAALIEAGVLEPLGNPGEALDEVLDAWHERSRT